MKLLPKDHITTTCVSIFHWALALAQLPGALNRTGIWAGFLGGFFIPPALVVCCLLHTALYNIQPQTAVMFTSIMLLVL
jgi:hypothetical protein